VQRGQSHPSFRSCQFSYPLPFRVQVCETQGSLPCFPSAVLSTRRLPSFDWVPVRPVPQRREYYEGATTPTRRIPSRLFGSLPGPTRFPLNFVLAAASAPERVEVPFPGQDHCSAGDPLGRRARARGREWGLSGSQATHPVPLLRSTTPAEPTVPRQWWFRQCCPCDVDGKGFSVVSISGLPRGFSTCCLRFTSDVATTHARLASGWLAGRYREGVEPSGSR